MEQRCERARSGRVLAATLLTAVVGVGGCGSGDGGANAGAPPAPPGVVLDAGMTPPALRDAFDFDVQVAGADPTCARDATSAFNQALEAAAHVSGTVTIPAGCYLVKDALMLPPRTPADSASFDRTVHIRGAGKSVSVIKVAPDFNLAAAGVFVLAQDILWVRGAILEGLSIVFTQPETDDPAALTHYPVAIDMDRAERTTIRNVDIWDAWDGISAIGSVDRDASGWNVESVGITAYNVAIAQDWSWDTIQIADLHCQYNFHDWGTPPNQNPKRQALFYGHSTCLKTGKADDVKITRSLLAGKTALLAAETLLADGSMGAGSYTSISGSSIDAGASIEWRNSLSLQVANSNFYYSTVNTLQSAAAILVTKGNVLVTNSTFTSGGKLGSRPAIAYEAAPNVPFSAMSLTVTSSVFNLDAGGDGAPEPARAISLEVPANAFLNAMIASNTLNRYGLGASSATYASAIVGLDNAGYAQVSVTGNHFTEEAGKNGPWISIDEDGPYVIRDNIVTANATSQYPAVRTQGVYQ